MNQTKRSELALIQTLYQSTLDKNSWPTLFDSFVSYTDSMDDKAEISNETISQHISQALALKEQLIENQNMVSHVFDRLPFGVIFLNEHMHVLHKNQYGYQFLLAQQNQEQLGKKLQNIILAQTQDSQPTTLVHTIDNKDYYLGVFLYEQVQSQKYLLYIYDNDQSFSAKVLKDNFGITQAETRTVNSLLRMGNTKDAADALSISIETLRSHLKSILRKTGTHNQTELMVKLLSGSQLLSELTLLDQELDVIGKQLINDAFIELGDTNGTPVFYIPSLFSFAWDFLGDQLFGWRRFFEQQRIRLIIINTNAMVSNDDWATLSLTDISSNIAQQVKKTYRTELQNDVFLVANNTGCGFALNLLHELAPKAVKLVSPCLPKSFIGGQDYQNADYKKMSVANQIPRRMWFKIAPYLISHMSGNPRVYFERKLSNQLDSTDQYKVRLWQENDTLVSMFCNYTLKARYKIAFDLTLIGHDWPMQDISCPIKCIVGDRDSYTCLTGVKQFTQTDDNLTYEELNDTPSTFDTKQWEGIFSLW